MKRLMMVLPLLFLLVGCMGPPTKFEKKYYDITTNEVTIIKVITNQMTLTNYHTITETVQVGTNVIVISNLVPVISTQAVLVSFTNVVSSWDYKPNTNAVALSQDVGFIANLFGPYGGLAGIITGGLLSLWGTLRSKKFRMTAESLSQIIETGSEILKTTPQGQKLDEQWKQWMRDHQTEAGVVKTVLAIMSRSTDNLEARAAADNIIELIKSKEPPPQ